MFTKTGNVIETHEHKERRSVTIPKALRGLGPPGFEPGTKGL
jgi:hypothetical protein